MLAEENAQLQFHKKISMNENTDLEQEIAAAKAKVAGTIYVNNSHSISPNKSFEEEQWLSGRVLDSRPRGRRVEPHQLHCVCP